MEIDICHKLAERRRSALKKRTVLWTRYGLLGLAAALAAVGVLRGEYLEVLQKAVRICLECIGIG